MNVIFIGILAIIGGWVVTEVVFRIVAQCESTLNPENTEDDQEKEPDESLAAKETKKIIIRGVEKEPVSRPELRDMTFEQRIERLCVENPELMTLSLTLGSHFATIKNIQERFAKIIVNEDPVDFKDIHNSLIAARLCIIQNIHDILECYALAEDRDGVIAFSKMEPEEMDIRVKSNEKRIKKALDLVDEAVDRVVRKGTPIKMPKVQQNGSAKGKITIKE